MDDTDREIERLLAPLREEPQAAGPGVSVERAMAAGRRRLRRRSRLAAAATAVVVAAMCGLLSVALSGPDGRDSVAGNDVGFDVLTRSFHVGSAGGFAPQSYESGRHRQQVRLRLERPVPGQEGRATVTLFAPGHLPRPGWAPAGRRMPDVYGREAVLLDDPVTAPGGIELAWRWSDTGWAFAHLDAGFPNLGERAHHVAQSVRPVEPEPLRVPFTVAAPGGDLEVTGVRAPTGSGAERGAVLFGPRGVPRPVATAVVSLRSDLAPGADIPVTGVLAGHPASVGDGRVVLFDVGPGWAIVAATVPGTPESSVPTATLEALAASVQVAADPDDPASWPGDPIR